VCPGVCQQENTLAGKKGSFLSGSRYFRMVKKCLHGNSQLFRVPHEIKTSVYVCC